MEARAALSRSGITSLPSNQSPVNVDMAPITSVTGPPPTSIPLGWAFNLLIPSHVTRFLKCMLLCTVNELVL